MNTNQILEERIKCAKSPVYFFDNYGYVFDATEKKVKRMKCFEYQKQCVDVFHKNQNSIILKSRQCLPENTYVDTPNGPKAIQDCKIGDSLYSYNIEKKIVEEDTISNAWCSGERQCVKIYFDNTDPIESGENHPFYEVNKKDWVRAIDLVVGQEILNSNKEKSVITKIEETEIKTCYDISVTGNENFLINGLLVHNTGLSVITAGYVAWRLMFRYDEKILIIANDGAGARRFLATVKQFIENTPVWLQPDSIVTNNQTKLEFSNNSWVEAKASSPNAGRGDSLTMLVLDETAFIKDAEAIWMAAGMALSATKGKCIMISTPNGTGSLYHKTWVGSMKKENDFVPLTVHWTQNPQSSVGLKKIQNSAGEEIDWSPWYEEQCRRMNFDSVKIAQELDLSFEGSKYLVIEQQLIDRYEKQVRGQKPNFYIKYDYAFKGTPESGSFILSETSFHAWKRPEQGRHYIVASDVARGDGKDFSTIQVLDAETLEQVAEYRDKIGVDLFPYLIDWVGRVYNTAYVVVECNSFGLAVAYSLRDAMKYPRMFYSKNIQDIHVRPSDYKVPEGVEIPGIQTTVTTRPLYIKALIEHMRENALILHSPRLTSEFGTFIMVGTKPQHEKGFNDDLIFALAIALYVRDTEYNNVVAADSMYRSMLGAISFSTNSTVGKVDYNQGGIKKDIGIPDGGSGLFLGSSFTGSDDQDLDWLLK